jgi:hypothetical protein
MLSSRSRVLLTHLARERSVALALYACKSLEGIKVGGSDCYPSDQSGEPLHSVAS